LPVFHAFSGCDVVSSFSGKGKKSAFEAWQACPQASEGFILLKRGQVEEAMLLIEKYVVALYDRTSSVSTVNQCRRTPFTEKKNIGLL